jgi:hypothetical protein
VRVQSSLGFPPKMRFYQSPVDAAILTTLLLPFLTAAINLDCTDIRADGTRWKLDALGGPKSVLHSVDDGASWENTTYTIDLCKPLKRDDKVPAIEKCPGGTRCKLNLASSVIV